MVIVVLTVNTFEDTFEAVKHLMRSGTGERRCFSISLPGWQAGSWCVHQLAETCHHTSAGSVEGDGEAQPVGPFSLNYIAVTFEELPNSPTNQAVQLLLVVSANNQRGLQITVRIFGQPKFLLHDGIAAGIFNADYISVGSGDPWCSLLQNSPEVLTLLLDRMKRDFETTAPKMRKPWGLKELDSRHLLEALSFITIFDPSLAHDLHIACYKENLQRVCAAFKACVRAFKDQVPAWFYTKVEAEIQQTCLWPKTDLKLSVVTT